MTPESVCEYLVSNQADVIKMLTEQGETMTKSMRKNLYSALLVLYGCDNPKSGEIYDGYVKALKGVNDAYMSEKQQQQLSTSEANNWVKLSKLRSVIPIYKDSIKGIIQMTPQAVYKKWKLLDLIQKYLVANLYVGSDALPPRRNLYANTKMIHKKDFDLLPKSIIDKTNWVIIPNKKKDRWQFVFTPENYKTGWKYGEQIIKIRTNSKLLPAFKIWDEYNISPEQTIEIDDLVFKTGRWLLINPVKKTKMAAGRLTRYINQTFSVLGADKKIGSSTIRKIYLSELYKNDTKLSKRMKTASKMGHDHTTAQLHYEKKNI